MVTGSKVRQAMQPTGDFRSVAGHGIP